ncbi:PTS lactose/cellobiose transporter subunit IIA [Oceanobacillus kapialis]|uniref:PTS lactose/cellobiose transporter subunit IIA n=1 Tax=Oceanobacillus kapialis TaxID=481353 RepID=UPI0038501F87
MNVDNLSMQIILHAGNAKGILHKTLEEGRAGNFASTEDMLKEASEELLKAHKVQTSFIQEEAQERLGVLPVILVHAQDHLMTVMSEQTLITEMIHLYKRQHELEQKVEQWLKPTDD